jgi:hypothetical protein
MKTSLPVTLAAVALAVGVTAPALAVTRHNAEAHTVTPAAASPATPTAARQRFVLSYATIHGKDRPVRILAAGPIQGRGTIVDSPIRQTKDGVILKSVITLADGKVVLRADEKYAVAMNLRSCTAHNFATGTWTIVSGTGAYSDATGHGTFTRRTFIVGAFDRDGQCLGRSAVPASETGNLVIDGTASR